MLYEKPSTPKTTRYCRKNVARGDVLIASAVFVFNALLTHCTTLNSNSTGTKYNSMTQSWVFIPKWSLAISVKILNSLTKIWNYSPSTRCYQPQLMLILFVFCRCGVFLSHGAMVLFGAIVNHLCNVSLVFKLRSVNLICCVQASDFCQLIDPFRGRHFHIKAGKALVEVIEH